MEVINCENLSSNPHCRHGPTLLFSRKSTGNGASSEEYFGCSAFRSKDGCGFHMKKSDYNEGKMKTCNLQIDRILELKNESKSNEMHFCISCNIPFKRDNLLDHGEHEIQKDMHSSILPTRFLHPLSNDKGEAQYFFSESTLNFFQNNLKNLKINKICCIGAPRLHEHLRSSFKSFLLDIDHRFLYFYDSNEFAWFNMFNFYFFEGCEKLDKFKKFLKQEDEDENILVFLDPPFGCRTEPLVQTIKRISELYRSVNNNLTIILPVMWIFPYFMKFYIQKFMPEMQMIDYKVNYDNHERFTNNSKKARKQGSPVRIFTNILENKFKLPSKEGYKFCTDCNKWTGIENVHCNLCKKCPSENGDTYRHCTLCCECVKPTYKHCLNCGRCTQKFEHSCDDYQKNLTCWICRQYGHTELKCEKWLEICKSYKTHQNIVKYSRIALQKGKKVCLICTECNHNEKNCLKRKHFLKEKMFLSECTNIFSKIVPANQ